jgi:hypothetical protein
LNSKPEHRKITPADCLNPNFRATKTKRRTTCGCPPQKLEKRNYSNFSVINGNCSFAFASDFTTKPSADSEVVFRAVAISLTKYFLFRA